MSTDKTDVNQGVAIEPQVTVNTDVIQSKEPTTADEMEAQERDLVIRDSVCDVLEYAQKPLSDAQIRAKSLSEEDIEPRPEEPA